MKNTISLLFLFLFFVACSDSDEDNNRVKGIWRIDTAAHFYIDNYMDDYVYVNYRCSYELNIITHISDSIPYRIDKDYIYKTIKTDNGMQEVSNKYEILRIDKKKILRIYSRYDDTYTDRYKVD